MIGKDARQLLEWVMQPHTDLACDLFGLVKTKSSDDPTIRYHIAGIVVFLAGLDKTLSLVVNLLYINGIFKWNEVNSGMKDQRAGYLEGGKGIGKKLKLLQSRGLDLSIVEDFVYVRNDFVHYAVIDASYKQVLSDDGRMDILPRGPNISYSGFSLSAIDATYLQNISDTLIQNTAQFLEEKKWYDGIEKLKMKLELLPIEKGSGHALCIWGIR